MSTLTPIGYLSTVQSALPDSNPKRKHAFSWSIVQHLAPPPSPIDFLPLKKCESLHRQKGILRAYPLWLGYSNDSAVIAFFFACIFFSSDPSGILLAVLPPQSFQFGRPLPVLFYWDKASLTGSILFSTKHDGWKVLIGTLCDVPLGQTAQFFSLYPSPYLLDTIS